MKALLQRSSLVLCIVIFVLAISAVSVLAATDDPDRLSAFPWWKYCENPLQAVDHVEIWHHLSLGSWMLFWLGLGSLCAGILYRLFRHKRREALGMAGSAIGLALLAAALAYHGLRSASPTWPHLMAEAVRPSGALPPLEIMWNGYLHQISQLVRDPLSLWPAMILPLALLLLPIYYFSAKQWQKGQAGLIAACLVALSFSILRDGFSDVPVLRVMALLIAAPLALQLALYKESRIAWLTILPFSTMAVMHIPALLPLLLIYCFGCAYQTKTLPANTRLLGVLLAATGALLGLIFFLLLDGKAHFDIALNFYTGGGIPSLVLLATILAGCIIALREGRLQVIYAAAAALSALFILPDGPARFLLSGCWMIIPLSLAAPAAAGAMLHLADTPKRVLRWMPVILLLAICGPNAADSVWMESPEVEQRYTFERSMIADLERERSVLYRVPPLGRESAPFPDFLAPSNSNLCLRQREGLTTDPVSHGKRWIYFGPECSLESPLRGPQRESCRFYRELYNMEDCKERKVIGRLVDGEVATVHTLRYCRVVGLKE